MRILNCVYNIYVYICIHLYSPAFVCKQKKKESLGQSTNGRNLVSLNKISISNKVFFRKEIGKDACGHRDKCIQRQEKTNGHAKYRIIAPRPNKQVNGHNNNNNYQNPHISE